MPISGSQSASPAAAEPDFVGLAGFRHALRQFLAFSESAVDSAGVTSPQYQAMLAIRAHPDQELPMKELAAELMLKPHGAVQLVNRLELQGLVERHGSAIDKRSVLLRLSPRGQRLVRVLANQHMAELLIQRPLLVESLKRLKAIAAPSKAE